MRSTIIPALATGIVAFRLAAALPSPQPTLVARSDLAARQDGGPYIIVQGFSDPYCNEATWATTVTQEDCASLPGDSTTFMWTPENGFADNVYFTNEADGGCPASGDVSRPLLNRAFTADKWCSNGALGSVFRVPGTMALSSPRSIRGSCVMHLSEAVHMILVASLE